MSDKTVVSQGHAHSYSTPCHEAVIVDGKNYARTYTECNHPGCDAVYVRCECGGEYWI